MTTKPHTAHATSRFTQARFDVFARRTHATATIDAAPSSVPRNAANTIAATTSTPVPGSFELIEPTCTADRMPPPTITRHTIATSAVAHPHRNALAALAWQPSRRAIAAYKATPATESVSASEAANMNATNAEPVRMEQIVSRMATSLAEM